MTTDEIELIDTMAFYGSSFAKALAQLYRVADPDNKERLLQAFPEIFAHYRMMMRISQINDELQIKALQPR